MGQAIHPHSRDAVWDAICRSQAVIEFAPDGTILWANDLFLATMGYALGEIVGRHHRIFCDEGQARSAAYAALWDKLAQGDFDAGEYRRLDKHAATSGCRPPIIRSSMPKAESSASSRSRPTPPRPRYCARNSRARSTGWSTLSRRSAASPTRPISSPSTPRSRRRGRAWPGGALRWSRPKSRNWRGTRARRPIAPAPWWSPPADPVARLRT